MTPPPTGTAKANGQGRGTAHHYGKYRGTVTDNRDPRNQGRIRVQCPEILGDIESGWALPCAPYAGDKSGVYTIPSVGAGVWVEFEAGDCSRPIWVGCWWAGGSVPIDEEGAEVDPDTKIARSEEGLLLALHDGSQTIVLSDANGRNILEIDVRPGTVTVKAQTRVIVDAPQIELVANATHPGVFGDSLMSYLVQAVAIFNTHMHPGQMAGPLPVTPAPPVAPLTPPTPALLSTKVRLG